MVELDIYSYVLYLVGATSLLGFIIYIVFYELFQRTGGRRVVGEYDDAALSPVMSGFIVEEPDFPSIKDVVVDILDRGWRGFSQLFKRGARSFIRDWYLIGYILLALLVLLAVLMG